MCFQSALLSSSCLVRAGGCAGHLGTGSWICLKMFFLEAGSYIVPRRNEKKKAPEGSFALSVLGAALSCGRSLSPAREEVGMGPPARWGPGRVLSGTQQRHTASLGAPRGPFFP